MSDHDSTSDARWNDDELDDYFGTGSRPAETDDEVETLLVRVTNPAASVSATVLLNGRIVAVDLSPTVTSWTEAQLADEIMVLATLARKQALAVQYSFTATFMRELGHDPAATRGLLERELGLPSPDDVLAEKAHIFATRYQDAD